MNQIEDLQSWLRHIDTKLSDLHLSDKDYFNRLENKIEMKASKEGVKSEISRLSNRIDKQETAVAWNTKQIYLFIGSVITLQVIIGWLTK